VGCGNLCFTWNVLRLQVRANGGGFAWQRQACSGFKFSYIQFRSALCSTWNIG
jgi:hypothetical protein